MNKFATLVAAAAVLGASAVGARFMISSREPPTKKPQVVRGVAVETLRVTRAQHRLDVRAQGVVVPARDLEVYPQVTGRVEWLYENLVPGTFVKRGQPLFRLDTKNYQLEIEQQRAEVERAQSALEIELGQQRIARSELEILDDLGHSTDRDLESNVLALRKPQLKAAEGDVAAARARLESTRLNLSRTSFAAPFAAVVVESSAEIGQLASPQTRLARLVGTERFWVRVALEKEKLAHVAIAGIGSSDGSLARVFQEVGSQVVERTGRVIRLLSDLEPQSRMARILVAIDDPYGLEQTRDGGARPFPILLDAYVDVLIAGSEQKQLVEVPRSAVREGDTIHLFDPKGGALRIKKLDVAWRLPDSVLVEAGVEHGDLVITSPIAGAVDGMKLRDVSQNEAGSGRTQG